MEALCCVTMRVVPPGGGRVRKMKCCHLEFANPQGHPRVECVFQTGGQVGEEATVGESTSRFVVCSAKCLSEIVSLRQLGVVLA